MTNVNDKFSVGDTVTRVMTGTNRPLRVSLIDDEFYHCGPWKFDKQTGAEVDEALGWTKHLTGSYLKELVK